MKITSGWLWLRYSIAASALSALSTSMSYFSRARARNRRADFESSTISARFAPMSSPRAAAAGGSVAQNPGSSIARTGHAQHARRAAQLRVEVGKASCHRRRRPLARVGESALPELLSQVRVAEQAHHGGGECVLLLGHEDRARAEVRGRDHRGALRHRLEQHQSLRLGARCEDEHVRRGVAVEERRVALQVTGGVHVLSESEMARLLPQGIARRTFACYHEH